METVTLNAVLIRELALLFMTTNLSPSPVCHNAVILGSWAGKIATELKIFTTRYDVYASYSSVGEEHIGTVFYSSHREGPECR